MQKKVLVFLVMSGIMMVSYLLVIAGPNPPGDFELYDSETANGTIIDTEVEGTPTLYCNVYVAYQNVHIDANDRNYATYHWARVYKTGGGTMHFKREWQHGWWTHPPEDDPITTSDDPWEKDHSYQSTVGKGNSVDPYTAVRPIQQQGNPEVKARPGPITLW